MSRKSPEPAGRKPVDPQGMRQRTRTNGSIRVWWEPRDYARKLGFDVVELDPERMSWSRKRAEQLNAEVAAVQAGGPDKKKEAARAGGRTISALIADYMASPHFKGKLSEKTRDSYRKLMLLIEKKWGVHRVGQFDKSVMNAWYETLYSTKGPRSAQALIRMMSILFQRAEILRWRPENSNPCYKLQIVTPAPRSRSGAEDELAAILAGADALGLRAMALAIRLAIYQGQRQTDIRMATRGAFSLRDLPRGGKGWVWQLLRSKRKNIGAMIVHPAVVPDLRAALAQTGTPAQPLRATDPLIRDEVTGQPYGDFLFNKRWRAILDQAASEAGGNCPSVKDLQFRDLRRTFGVLARAAGASKDDIADVLGNSAAVNPLLGETYMPASFETASRAIAAVPEKKTGRKKA